MDAGPTAQSQEIKLALMPFSKGIQGSVTTEGFQGHGKLMILPQERTLFLSSRTMRSSFQRTKIMECPEKCFFFFFLTELHMYDEVFRNYRLCMPILKAQLESLL